jgi:hypothetical protein
MNNELKHCAVYARQRSRLQLTIVIFEKTIVLSLDERIQ